MSLSLFCLLIFLKCRTASGTQSFPSNAPRCEQCHGMPARFGSSPLTVQRVGRAVDGKFVPGVEGGVLHRNGSSRAYTDDKVAGERVSLSLLGDGYIEAIADKDIERNADAQHLSKTGIDGEVVPAPALESGGSGAAPIKPQTRPGRFGWKSQHSSLMSACADSLRNELGIRNRLYPQEYANHDATAGPTPFDTSDPTTGETGLQRLVDEIRLTSPPERDQRLANGIEIQAGEKVFAEIGCALCHVATYKTVPPGTLINGGTYSVPNSIGGKTIHPYSDFLLHDIGTGDGIPQAAKPEYLDQSTAMKFRTPPLWGLRFRSWLMHDGKSATASEAISRHGGEAAAVQKRYEQLTPLRKRRLRVFLSSL